jgi:hypothetical protein
MHLGLKLGLAARRGGGGGGGSGGSTVPDAFAAGGWSMSTGSGEAELDITLSTLPSDGGATITDVEWAIAGSGSWASLPSYSGTGTYTITAPLASTSYEVFIRAVNSEGNSTGNTSKTATSGAAAASATMPAFEASYSPSQASNVYTQAGLALGAGEFVVGIATTLLDQRRQSQAWWLMARRLQQKSLQATLMCRAWPSTALRPQVPLGTSF